ncbi:hypothetical protein KC345_g2857 [Hortaea werneckii]|nr:hypothetical protein KC345_g2857 [Hortaea werneckii]
MADNWCSHGLGLPRQLTDRQPGAGYPMDERLFQNCCATAHPSLSADPREGIWAYMIRLVDILGPTHDLNRRRVEEDLDEKTVHATVDSLTRRLDAWMDTLPQHMQMNDNTLESFRQDGYGGPFVALHLGYHHYATLLYFQYLDLQKPRSASTEVNVEKCKGHASMYSKLLAQSRNKPGCEVVYATVGHMTVVSSSVLLHTLLLGTSDEVDDVRQDLTANFAALLELRELWPSLDRIIDRLSAFQDACLSNVDSNTHRIDDWMMRFLLEHSLPLEPRLEQDTQFSSFIPFLLSQADVTQRQSSTPMATADSNAMAFVRTTAQSWST